MPIVMGTLGSPEDTFRCHTVGFRKLVRDNKPPQTQTPDFCTWCHAVHVKCMSSMSYNLNGNLDYFPLFRRRSFSSKSVKDFSVILLLWVSELVHTEAWLQSPDSNYPRTCRGRTKRRSTIFSFHSDMRQRVRGVAFTSKVVRIQAVP